MVQVIWRKNLKYSFILSKIEVQESNCTAEPHSEGIQFDHYETDWNFE